MIYEWKCKTCGFVVEVDRRLSEFDKPPELMEYRRKDNNKNCQHTEWVKVYSSTVPFEQLRDRGVFERTHWKRGT